MKFGVAAKYIQKFFYSGISKDTAPELEQPEKGGYSDANGFHISVANKNAISECLKEYDVYGSTGGFHDRNGNSINILDTYTINFFYVSSNSKVFILFGYNGVGYLYYNGTCVASSNKLPINKCTGGYSEDTDELYLTDNVTYPLVLNVSDMYNKRATSEEYFSEFDPLKYTVNVSSQINQPVFIGLENVGDGNGLRYGTYSYAVRYASINGEYSAWSPYTPFIPIPAYYDISQYANNICPGYKVYGGLSSSVGSRYAIRLRIRVTNLANFDWIEIKRIPNNSGTSIDFKNMPEYIKVSFDANGNVLDIKSNPINVFDFVDRLSNQWMPYNEEENISLAPIKTAKYITYFNKSLILSNIKYESRDIPNPKSIFTLGGEADNLGFAIKEDLGINGYNDIYNQVYKKSLRCGEVYSWGVKFYDAYGNKSFVVPIENNNYSLVNYKIPERREILSSEAYNYSESPCQCASNLSNRNDSVDSTYEVIKNPYITKGGALSANIVDDTDVNIDYLPITPTGIGYGYNNNGNKVNGINYQHITSQDTGYYNPHGFGVNVVATGMVFKGINVNNLPSWVKAFSIVRSKPAGRVVCQGLGVYALTEAVDENHNLTKSLTKFWFYSPELDTNIGDKTYLIEDLKNNPQNYKIQLVSPLGFFTEFYNDIYDSTHTVHGSVDMISHARILKEAYAAYINPNDSSSVIGRGDGYVSFGRWRNYKGINSGGNGDYIATGIYNDTTYQYKFGLSAFNNVDLSGRNYYGNLFELSVADNIYYKDELVRGTLSNDNNVRLFHEPVYVINIIRDDATVGLNNINEYNDIGHYQKLESLIGISNGLSGQEFILVDERPEDCKTETGNYLTTGARFIWVDNKRWYDATVFASNNPSGFSSALATLKSQGYYTVNGVNVYGFYSVVQASSGAYYIKFPYKFADQTPVVPTSGSKIYVKYDVSSPIKVFLGDTVIGEIAFPIIDAVVPHQFNASDKDQWFRILGAMPVYRAQFSSTYKRPKNPAGSSEIETTELYLQYVRQWLMTFYCESSINLPLMSGNYWPATQYILRPEVFANKTTNQTVEEYLTAQHIYIQYNVDYPNEFEYWRRGGFKLDYSYNFDYNKSLPDINITKPVVGFTEKTSYPKRIVWTKFANLSNYEYSIIRSVPVSNYYDINVLNCNNIQFLYSTLSDRGYNLYAFTDKGVVLLLTNKNILSDANGDEVAYTSLSSKFIGGELVINNDINIPSNYIKAEGSVVIKNNYVPSLVFTAVNDILMMLGNNIYSIFNDWKSVLEPELQSYSTSKSFITFNTLENEIYVKFDDNLFIYNVGIGNWVGRFDKKYLSGASNISSTYLLGSANSYMALVRVHRDYSNDVIDTIGGNDFDYMYVDFPVNVIPFNSYEFIDIFINSTSKPKSIRFSTTSDYNDNFCEVNEDKIYQYAENIWYCMIPRTESSKNRLQGNVLYVKIFYNKLKNNRLSGVQIGCNPMVGG